MEKPAKDTEREEVEEVEGEKTFEELGLDARLTRALIKKGINKTTPIQRVAIPLILVSFFFPHSLINANFLLFGFRGKGNEYQVKLFSFSNC